MMLAHERRHVYQARVDQDLAEFGVGGQELLDAREVVGVDLLELACLFERLHAAWPRPELPIFADLLCW
jgi:hypothetical protein